VILGFPFLIVIIVFDNAWEFLILFFFSVDEKHGQLSKEKEGYGQVIIIVVNILLNSKITSNTSILLKLHLQNNVNTRTLEQLLYLQTSRCTVSLSFHVLKNSIDHSIKTKIKEGKLKLNA